MIHLMNGHSAERVRSSDGCTALSCGCAHTAREYVQMCEADFTDWQATHEHARAEHEGRDRAC